MKIMQSGQKFFITKSEDIDPTTEGLLVSIEDKNPARMVFGSVLNHCPYDEWKPVSVSDVPQSVALQAVLIKDISIGD